MKMTFVRVRGLFGAGGSYLRGKDVTGTTVRHLPGVQLYPTQPLELTGQQKAALEAQTLAVLRDHVMSADQLAELNRQPSLVSADLVTVEFAVPKPDPELDPELDPESKPKGKGKGKSE